MPHHFPTSVLRLGCSKAGFACDSWAVRALTPQPEPIDVYAVYAADARPATRERPWVLCNMVTGLDGATATGEKSGDLGGEGDHAAFHAIRAVADVIVVAAGTVRAENYGPAKARDEVRQARVERGQAPVPRIAVVTRSLSLDPDARLFSEPSETRPLIVTVATADQDRFEELERVADVRVAGDDDVDLGQALALVAAECGPVVLVEGGPSLNGQLFDRDLIDEVCLSLAPTVVGGSSAKLSGRDAAESMLDFDLDRVLEQDGTLILRYVRGRRG